ncbi:MAG: calcium-binding protein [Planctomycetota bacterium]|nr:calcium-binding protein [Planctomycetota bacterium]
MHFELERCALLLLLAPTPALAQTTVLVSVNSVGVPGNGHSEQPSISLDGRCIMFTSRATDLVANDIDVLPDAYVRDLSTGVTELVNVDSSGAHAVGGSVADAISADGRFVAFSSVAGGLISGDAIGDSDVFVRDRAAGTTLPLSVDSAGVQGNGASNVGVVSPDGRFIAFRSVASNLVPGDTNAEWDVFVRDLQTGTIERANVTSGGAQVHGDSYCTSLSEGGRFVLFSSVATDIVPGDTNNERDVFVRDRLLGTTRRITVDSIGTQSNGDTHAGYLSADGRFATYVSLATNLVAGDTNGVADVFVHELATSVTTRVSVRSDGGQADAWSTGSGITPDGRFVAVLSDATNLAPGDGGFRDMFVHDRWTGRTDWVSAGASGAPPDADSWSWGGAISADARLVTFFTTASNMGTPNPSSLYHSYVRDRGPIFTTTCVGDATTCPCGNAGLARRGCNNSAASGGALLIGAGSANLSNDSIVFSVSGEVPGALTLVVQGNALVAPLAFGDGLLCAGGNLKRMYLAVATGGALTVPQVGDASVSARSAALGDPLTPGSSRVYQAYYRDAVIGFCASGTFNLSQALVVTWGS